MRGVGAAGLGLRSTCGKGSFATQHAAPPCSACATAAPVVRSEQGCTPCAHLPVLPSTSPPAALHPGGRSGVCWQDSSLRGLLCYLACFMI